MIGETVGSYRIVAKVSVGGMGTVYKAQHTIIGKAAAVKVLNPELCTNRDIVNRFLKEAQATTTIKHPGIVDVIDFGYMVTGHAYLIMEFLEGMSLAQRLKTRGVMHEGEAAMLLRSICSALAAAHDKGIVHRDLKPDNIFLVPDPESATGERPKLLDFGIAKLTDIGIADSSTKTGAVMGTPTYMSPEQCKGTGDVDHRADLYSLGCIYYELVTGRPPFTNLGAGELIGTHIYVEPEPPSKHQPGLTRETEALILALLQKRPEQRPQSAKELGHRLTLIGQQQSWITPNAPSGITAPGLRELAGTPLPSQPSTTTPYGYTPTPHGVVPTPHGVVPTPHGMAHAAGHGHAPAPHALTPAPASHVAPTMFAASSAEKPTTLSGAASQSVMGMQAPARRSRRGLGIALLGAAIVSGAGIAIVQLTSSSSSPSELSPAVSAPAPAADPEPKPAAPVVEANPAEPIAETKPAEPIAETKPAEPTPTPTPTPTEPTAPVAETTPADPPKPGELKPAKPAESKPTPTPTPSPGAHAPAKPKPKPARPDPSKTLIETELE